MLPEISMYVQTVVFKLAIRIYSLSTLFVKLENNKASKTIALIDSDFECNLIFSWLAAAFNLSIRQIEIRLKGIYSETRQFLNKTFAKIILANRGVMQEFFVVKHLIGNKDCEKHVLLSIPFVTDMQLTFRYN